MSEHPRSAPVPEDHGDAPMYPADLTTAMQAELAALADIEADYAKKRHDLETWTGSQKMKRKRREEDLRSC